MRKTIENHVFSGENKHLTISLGVITTNAEEESIGIFKKVDDCLYKAKETGRNKTVQY